MRVRVNFGLAVAVECKWYESVTAFPTLMTYRGTKYQFVVYDVDKSKAYDFIFHFSEVQSYDPNFHATTYVSWENRFQQNAVYDCQCGAVHTQFKWDHMRFCPKWIPWDKL